MNVRAPFLAIASPLVNYSDIYRTVDRHDPQVRQRDDSSFIYEVISWGSVEALRASAVPLPGKKILQPKVRSVNPYRHKGMTERTVGCSKSVAGKLR
jgi:hypothetical protein